MRIAERHRFESELADLEQIGPVRTEERVPTGQALAVPYRWICRLTVPSADPTDPSYGITKSGVPVTKGIVAVDPKVIPLGTRLYVPGYGFAVAGDTGGGIVGNMIDLGYPDGVASDWHTGWVDVYILGP